MNRPIAFLVAFALAWLSPGLPFYEAWGANNKGDAGGGRRGRPGEITHIGKDDVAAPLGGEDRIELPGGAELEAERLRSEPNGGEGELNGAAVHLESRERPSAPNGDARGVDGEAALGETAEREGLAGRAARRILGVVRASRDIFSGKPSESVKLTRDLPKIGALDLRRANGAAEPAKANEAASAPVSPAASTDAQVAAAPAQGLVARLWGALTYETKILFGAMVAVLGGMEGFGVGQPAQVRGVFGVEQAKDIIPDIGILGSLAGFLGRLVAPVPISRLGPKRAYLSLVTATVLLCAAAAFVTGQAYLTYALFFSIIIAFRALVAASAVTQGTLQALLMKQDHQRLNGFSGLIQMVVGVQAALITFVAGGVIESLGHFTGSLWVLAFTLLSYVVAIGFILLLKVPAAPTPPDALPASTPADAEKPARPGFWKEVSLGARIVLKSPLLRNLVFMAAMIIIYNQLMITQLAPSFASYLIAIGVAGEAKFAPIYAAFYAASAIGSFGAGWYLLRHSGGRPPENESEAAKAERAEAGRRSMLRWVRWGALSLLLMPLLSFPLPPLGAVLGLPAWLAPLIGGLTLPALALAPMAFAWVLFKENVGNFFTSRLPKDVGSLSAGVSFYSAFGMLVMTTGLVGFKYLFSGLLPFGYRPVAAFLGLSGAWPFIVTAALSAGAAVAILLLLVKIDRLSAPSAPKKS